MIFLLLLDGATAMDKSDFLRELKILKEVNKYPHPNILQLIGACSTTGNTTKSMCWSTISYTVRTSAERSKTAVDSC